MIIKCKSCNYPVMGQMRSCPNCGVLVAENDIELITCAACGAEVESNLDYCPECGEPLYEDVVQNETAPDNEVVMPVCTLRPITLNGERRASERTFEDEGDGVSLSRGNTMPSDSSIDDELQAHLFFYNGQWFIEEGVEDHRSTFVHAGKGIKLAPGDIIRLGDREFEFNIKTE